MAWFVLPVNAELTLTLRKLHRPLTLVSGRTGVKRAEIFALAGFYLFTRLQPVHLDNSLRILHPETLLEQKPAR